MISLYCVINSSTSPWSLWPLNKWFYFFSPPLHQSISPSSLFPSFKSSGIWQLVRWRNEENKSRCSLLLQIVCAHDKSSPSEVRHWQQADYVTEPMKRGYCVGPKNSSAAKLKPPPKRRSREVRIPLELQEKRCDSKMSFKIKITPLLMCIRASRHILIFFTSICLSFTYFITYFLFHLSCFPFSPYIFFLPPTWSVFLYFLRSLPPITHFPLPPSFLISFSVYRTSSQKAARWIRQATTCSVCVCVCSALCISSPPGQRQGTGNTGSSPLSLSAECRVKMTTTEHKTYEHTVRSSETQLIRSHFQGEY